MARNKNQKSKLPVRKLKKDPGVPKLPNLKVRNELRKASHQTRPGPTRHDTEDTPMATETSLSVLAAELPSDPSTSAQAMGSAAAQAKRQYIRTLHNVIEQSDIIMLVLDARDPEGCRSRLVEEEVHRRENEGKRLVFVLNKIDLVPQENALAWIRYLKHTAPTIPFRSSTQHQSTHLKSRSAPGLMNLLKSYKPSPSSSITVGVVGYPNVGKSSLINSLKRSKVCAVAAEAGWTRDLQSVQLERGVRIIDSPGVVFDNDDPADAHARAGVLLRNVVKVEDVDDPLAVVEEIFARTEKETLRRIYNLPEWNSMLEFLTMLALSSGRLLKGGSPDILSTARTVLTDWNNNKIPYFSLPPSTHPSSLSSSAPGAQDVGEARIVQGGFSKAFDLGALYGEAMQQDEEGGGGGAMDEDGNEMESDDPLRALIPRKRSLSPSPTPAEEGKTPPHAKRTKLTPTIQSGADPTGPTHALSRKTLKATAKKERKQARRAAKRAERGMAVDDVGDAIEFTFRVAT